MEKKRPQLNLDELYQLKWLLGGVLALLSAWTVLYMDVDAWLWLTLITVTVPLVLKWPSLTLRMPRWLHRLAFPLFVAIFAGDYFFNKDPLPATIRLALMLVLYRTITPRRRRDDLQLIVLGLFLVVVAGVLSVSLAFALQIVVFTACTLLFLLVLTLIESAEAGQPAPAVLTVAPPWMQIEWRRLARRLRATTDWRVTVLAGGLFTGVVGLSVLLFFAIPRFEFSNRFFLDQMISKKPKTGFSDNVGFGDVTDIQQDTSVALRVDVSDPRQIPVNPYWRMLVLDRYQNATFSRSPELERQLELQKRRAAQVAGTSRPRLGDPIWTFYLEPGISRYLPLLGSFNQLFFSNGAQDYGISDDLRIVCLAKVPSRMFFAYRVEGLRFEPALGEPEVRPQRRLRDVSPDMDMPAIDGRPTTLGEPTFLKIDLDEEDTRRFENWAKALNAPADDAPEFSRLACGWLWKNHGYSLQMELNAGTSDPLVRWLDSKKPGHCELFAGAFAILARSAGYPARLVTGFRGGTWNTVANNLSIRNSDAHAWCEIYDHKTRSWLRVDPTPGSSGPGQTPAGETNEAFLQRIGDHSWTAKLDGLRMFWYRRIVDFDQRSQAELARGARDAIESRAKKIKAAINARLQAIGEWLQGPWDVVRLLIGGGGILALAGLILGWHFYGRGWWLHWRSGRTRTRTGTDPVRREAGRWLRRLRASTVVTDETAAVHAELEQLRYGPRAGWPNPQGAFRRAKRAVRQGGRKTD